MTDMTEKEIAKWYSKSSVEYFVAEIQKKCRILEMMLEIRSDMGILMEKKESILDRAAKIVGRHGTFEKRLEIYFNAAADDFDNDLPSTKIRDGSVCIASFERGWTGDIREALEEDLKYCIESIEDMTGPIPNDLHDDDDDEENEYRWDFNRTKSA